MFRYNCINNIKFAVTNGLITSRCPPCIVGYCQRSSLRSRVHRVKSWWADEDERTDWSVLVRITAVDGCCSCSGGRPSCHNGRNAYDNRILLAAAAAAKPRTSTNMTPRAAHAAAVSFFSAYIELYNELRWQHVDYLWWGVTVCLLLSASVPRDSNSLLCQSSCLDDMYLQSIYGVVRPKTDMTLIDRNVV